MRPKLLPRYAFVAAILLPIGWTANAATLSVNCGSKTGFHSIGAAIKALQSFESHGPSTINVSGACHENVLIQGMDRLTLNALNGASITDASGGKLDVLHVIDSRDVSINGFTINAGADGVSGSSGINCDDASICRLSGNTIQGALDAFGLIVSFEAIARVNGDIFQGNDSGIGVATTSEVQANNFISRNNATGILVTRGQANIGDCTVENNSGDGASVSGNALLNVNSCSFSKNGGNGVSLTSGSYARLGAAIITGNAGSGVFLRDLSMADFRGARVTGNLGG
ncbi:MAG TPA: right-handed parallel beta-helix repeat-containing protein, partial [Burkholderiaceae bacterium]|nr:right-handed parallel beta-helix repeat-containing protein [Burkholderiaceae bacterium]